jgi:hypothetical protein
VIDHINPIAQNRNDFGLLWIPAEPFISIRIPARSDRQKIRPLQANRALFIGETE